jgi:cell wall-associated NlpC family hydrolase
MRASLYADMIGIPYLRAGRTAAGMDCVGVFLEMMRRIGADVPQYGSDPGILGISLARWDRMEFPEIGAGVLMRSSDPPWHLGVVVGPNLMIHGKEHCGVCVERFDSSIYSRRIEGFYKCRQA